MKMSNEAVAVLVTVFVLGAVPLALFGYDRVYLPRKFPGARIVTLTAVAADGVWTEDSVVGTTYWRKRFEPVPAIEVREGQPIVLRLKSADVLHSFAIPALGIGPIDVPAGKVREVALTAREPGELLFLCWQVCSPVHGKLQGRIVVVGSGSQPAKPVAAEEPDLR